MFDLKIVFVGLSLFQVLPQDSNPEWVNVDLVNATRTAPAFGDRGNADCRPDPNTGVACAWDGTELHEHSPWLVLDPRDLTTESRHATADYVVSIPDELVWELAGNQAQGVPLLGRWVTIVDPNVTNHPNLVFPEKRRGRAQKPQLLRNDANAFGEEAKSGWVASLRNEVRQNEVTYTPEKREWLVGVDKLVIANVGFKDGEVKGKKPRQRNGSYMIWDLNQEDSDNQVDFPKAISEQTILRLKRRREPVTICLSKERNCGGDDPLRLVFKRNTKVFISNLPTEKPTRLPCSPSGAGHFAWLYELVIWKKPDGTYVNAPDCGLPLLVGVKNTCPNITLEPRDGCEDFQEVRFAGSNALCPGAQWP